MWSSPSCHSWTAWDFCRRVHGDTRGGSIIPQNSFFAYNNFDNRIMSLRDCGAVEAIPHLPGDCFAFRATKEQGFFRPIFAANFANEREFFKNQFAKIRAKRFAAEGFVSLALNSNLFSLWLYSQ